VIINLCLIPVLSIYGACIASITAEVTVLLICYFNTRDMIDLKLVLKNNAWVAVASVVMFLLVTLIAQFEMHILLKLLVEVSAGVAIYVAITAATKNEIFWNILGKVKNLLRRRG
jgi:O-antigen/teichoic acid export membrane protein